MAPNSDSVLTNPPGGQAIWFEERTMVTSTITTVLKSALVTKEILNLEGQLVTAGKPPQDLTEQTFKEMDVGICAADQARQQAV